MKRIIRLFAAFAAFALLCSCKSADTSVGGITETAAMSEGNLDIYCYSAETYNPLFAVNKANMYLSWICFEPLMKAADDRSAVTVLARGYFISEDGLEWTVPLRDDVYWHDGTKFGPADVVKTCEVIMDNPGSVYAYNLSNVKKVEAHGEDTVKFYLNSPQSGFADLLEFPIVKKEQCTVKKNFPMTGTGCFKYIGTENKCLKFEANDKWWGGKPTIKTVTATMLPDKETSVYAFNSKVIDVVPASIKDWSNYPSASDRGAEYTTGDFFYLKLNPSSERLSDYETRRAIARAIDKKALCDKALLSHGVAADTIMNPKWKFYSSDSAVTVYNPEKAREYVTEGFSLKLIVNSDSEIKANTAAMIRGFLGVCGIDAQIITLDWDNFTAAIGAGDYDIAVCETNYPPDLIPAAVTEGSVRAAEEIAALQSAGVDEERARHFAKLQTVINEELTVIPLFFDMGVLLYNENITGGLAPTVNNIYNDIHLWKLV